MNRRKSMTETKSVCNISAIFVSLVLFLRFAKPCFFSASLVPLHPSCPGPSSHLLRLALILGRKTVCLCNPFARTHINIMSQSIINIVNNIRIALSGCGFQQPLYYVCFVMCKFFFIYLADGEYPPRTHTHTQIAQFHK